LPREQNRRALGGENGDSPCQRGEGFTGRGWTLTSRTVEGLRKRGWKRPGRSNIGKVNPGALK